MKSISFNAIYVLWLREMKRFFRNKSRVIGSLGIPFFFLAFLGAGFSSVFSMPGMEGTSYLQFLAPGIVGMVMLFASMFAGISVLWDRQFGFLKEIMVTPVSRLSIMLGRVAGGVTTAIVQGLLILVIGIVMGLAVPGIYGFLGALMMMLLISVSFISIGLIFASLMEDMQGFQLIMNFLIMPVFLLSGALFPLSGAPAWLHTISLANPLTYGVDGLRFSLIGIGQFPLWLDASVLAVFGLVMITIGAYLFGRTQV
jgi:ABC-2 type transport system permease protein